MSRTTCPALALFGLVLVAALAGATDVTFQLAKTLKKTDVVYVLTHDPDARQLKLSDSDWKMFMTGRLAAEPPARQSEEPPLFHQAFDPATTVSDELLPGLAALDAINGIDQIPAGKLVETLVTEPEKYSSEMKLAAEAIGTIMGGGVLGGLASILKERTFNRYQEDLARHSLNVIYGAYRDARARERLDPAAAFSAVEARGGGLSEDSDPRFKVEWQWMWGSFHDLLEKLELPADAASVNRTIQHYFEIRYQRSAYEPVTMEDAVEDLVRGRLAEAKTAIVKELNYHARRRLQDWHKQIQAWANRAAELANFPNCKYDEALPYVEKVRLASPEHPWLRQNESGIRQSKKDAELSQQRVREAQQATNRGQFQAARALLAKVKEDGTACDLILAENELKKVETAEREARDGKPTLGRSQPAGEEKSQAEKRKEGEKALEKVMESTVTGAAAPPPPVREEPGAAKPVDSPACRQIREQGCIMAFPGMERFPFFMVVQMGPADAGGCVMMAFYPGMTPEQARQTAEMLLRQQSRQAGVNMRIVHGPVNYQSAMDFARRACREKSGTNKIVQTPMPPR